MTIEQCVNKKSQTELTFRLAYRKKAEKN